MTHRVFNLSNILDCIAFILLLLIPGAVEAEKYIIAIIMIIAMAVLAHLSMKEDEKKRIDPGAVESKGSIQKNYTVIIPRRKR